MSKFLKIGVASFALVVASTIAASAESFTFSGSGKTMNQVMASSGGTNIGGSYATSTTNTTYASGRKSTSQNDCMQWTAQPGSMFTTQGVCTADAGDGKFSVIFSCQADADGKGGDCWGRLTGMSGAYENKLGMVSWHSTNGDNNMTVTYEGTGMWN